MAFRRRLFRGQKQQFVEMVILVEIDDTFPEQINWLRDLETDHNVGKLEFLLEMLGV